MIHKRRIYEDFVVKLLSKNGKTRDVVIVVETDTTEMPGVYSYYLSGLLAIESKAKEGEIVVRISKKGYS